MATCRILIGWTSKRHLWITRAFSPSSPSSAPSSSFVDNPFIFLLQNLHPPSSVFLPFCHSSPNSLIRSHLHIHSLFVSTSSVFHLCLCIITIHNSMLFTKAEMARRTRGAAAKSSVVAKSNVKMTPINFEKTANVVVGKKRSTDHRPTTKHINFEGHSSYHHGSSAKSCKKDDKVVEFVDESSSWPKLITLFDCLAKRLVKQDSEATHKITLELAKVNKLTSELETTQVEVTSYKNKLTEMARDKDDALGKLQRTIEDYARHREERQAANRA
ncbi:hypothetical protein VNO80_15521 [Phaseolus coccineus]|uniref:Uncharacterized protein n=1 Tax=Phaseolus coccineus TaxID=3886 RepID=A0AAN9R730_PHACN